MIYEVIITDQANVDLRGIYEYITFELLSPDNAAGQLDRLEEHILGLEEFPEKYRLYGNEPWHNTQKRRMDMVTSHTPLRCYNYSVLYYRVIIKLVFDIPTFIHNTNNCYV